MKSRKDCGLIRRQAKICEKNVEFMPSVVSASKQTILTCQRIFADRRWNCSSVNLTPYYLPDIARDTREQAFVHALSAAALASSVAQTCASGSVFNCGCGPFPKAQPRGDYEWGGCADNIRVGLRFSKNFADVERVPRKPYAVDDTVSLRHLVHRHNNQAGRKAVQNTVKIQCKCHGVSGTCTTKTCWRTVAQLDVIGQLLKRRYLLAAEVLLQQFGQLPKLLPVNTQLRLYTPEDLVYVTKSPDYCTYNLQIGSFGTVGRYCNSTSNENIGCTSMCCGRGYVSYLIEQLERCHCKYVWCCFVKCKTCSSWVEVNECK